MRVFPKPIVVVSKCIEFEPVRWDGRIIADEFVKTLKNFVEFIPTCPEVEIGLSVPRDPIRIVKKDQTLRLIQPSSGIDFTEKILQFSNSFLSTLNDVDGFILKSKSPSSAFKDARIYPSEGKVAALGRGPGFFGRAILEKFPNKAIEDESRLLNERIRQHFLTKIFTLADFRETTKMGSDDSLVSFQARNKLLFTAYNQTQLHIMGRLVAERKQKPFKELVAEYETHLYETLKSAPRIGSNYNVLTKAAGYFTHKLSNKEKAFFLDLAQKYKKSKAPLSAPLNVLKSWIIRFDETYLEEQTFFEPFPEGLIPSINSKGNDDKDFWT